MSNETAITSLKEKIDDLNQNAWEVRVTDLPKSFELSQESVKLARSINYPKGLAEGLRSLGFSYVRYSKNDEAAPLLKESLSLYQSLKDLKGQAVVYEYLGIIERNWGNLGASLDLLLKANKLVLQIDSQEIEITCSYQLGVTYKHLGDHENALDYLYKTLSLAKKMNFTLMEAYATNIIGSIYFDNGNYNQALDCYQQGLIIRQQSHDKWGEAGSLDNIGFTYLKLNDLDKAIDYCKQSLAICQSTGDKKGEANALLHLGEIYEQAGDIKQAAGFSNESLEIRKARGDKRGETEVLLFLADLYKNRTDIEDHQIFEWLSGALKIADEIKAQDLLSKAYYNLHEYYQQKGNFKESLVQLEAHFQIEKELHKNSINQKIANLEISHKAEVVSQRNKELTELNEKIEKANEELKIEASLEKIRSRSLAMHKSDELKDVITVVFEKLKELGLVFEDVGIYLFTEGKKDSVIWVAAPVHLSEPILVNLPYSEKIFEESEIFRDYWMAKEKGENTFNKTYSYNDKNRYFDHLEKSNRSDQVPVSVKEFQMQAAGYTATLVTEKHSALWIDSWSGQTISIEGFNVLKRVARVFEQAYTRFLDLQKAEAQTRESQIELALERVRARTMAMQKSDELREAVLVIYEQLQQLNFDSKACNIIIIDKGSGSAQYWVSGFSQEIFPESYSVPYLDHPYQDELLKPWKQGDKYVVYEYTGKMKQSFDEIFFTQTDFRNIPEEAKKVMIGLKSVKLSTAFISYGALQSIGAEPLSEEKATILKRFAKVFEQTYTRFLDLQKAEAQAREANIEAALEKVRSRSLAMRKAEELGEVVTVVVKKLKELDIPVNDGVAIVTHIDGSKDQVEWLENPGFSSAIKFNQPYYDHPVLADYWKARNEGLDFINPTYTAEENKSFLNHIFQFTDYQHTPQEIKDYCLAAKTYSYSAAFQKHSSIFINDYSGRALSTQEIDIVKRFSKVFEQAYVRFLDLQKAEAQAREAHIEAALEKVRSRSLAMHTANELGEVVTVIVEKLRDLGVVLDANGVVLCTYFQNSKNVLHWIVSPDYSMAGHYLLTYFDHPILNVAWQSKENGDEYFSRAFSVEEKNSFFEHAFEHSDYRHFPDEFKQWIFQNDKHILSFAWQKNSAILIPSHTGVLPSEEDVAILKRFSKVFEQSYVRFLDLQKAEAQAREAQVEASLERIRGKAMAMHSTEEIDEVLEVLFDQFDVLGIVPMSTHLTLINLETNSFKFRETGKGGRKSFGEQTVPIDSMDIWKEAADKWRNMEPLSLNKLHFPKESLPLVWQVFHESFASMPEGHKIIPEDYPDGIYHTAGNCKFGYIGMNQVRPATEEEEQIVLKFAVEFGRLYQRYLDLQKAEAQTKEARIEAALERVRSRTMGMQKSEELKDVIQVVYEQFVHLNINIEHTGFVMDYKVRDDYDIWIADQLGVPSHVTIPYFDSVYYNRFNEAKKKGEDFFAVNLDFEEKNRFYQKIIEHVPGLPEGAKEFLFSVPGLAISTVLLENVCLYIENFSGIPYSDEENATLMRFGKVFQQTYTRFNDLKLAEAHAVQAEEDLVKLQTEKKRAEDALSELQVTQKQLIQAEKMASLGELTAGIAHEIQNPLNFVNNFSDVNKELLVEMKEEIEKGNTEEVIAIANDIISNEEKINHHGKRADAIVKGMLQHSRSSSGVKEPTDINELVDEYLRLAYHGLRAKDKSFNATMKTDFDESIGKINIVSQEIGRAVLNLITNAFYAVTEKKKAPPPPEGGIRNPQDIYEPTVTIKTLKNPPSGGRGAEVVISVKDNGSGMSQKVLDKIFQPFFTTKPTGQGTGLGLSLSYDIVKAHSGEIKVKTKDGEGSEFIISLPV